MHKEERQEYIRSLVEQEAISRQSVIAERLAAKGLQVTQASVSRDLDELGISKQSGVYQVRQTDNGADLLRLVSLEPAGTNLLVGKCASGMASAITVRIDSAGIPEIVGTIAGDDTIFVAVREARLQPVATRKIWELFGR